MNSQPIPPSSGRFVRNGDVVTLVDTSRGNRWPIESVSIQQGLFGGRDEGQQKLPRCWEFDEEGNAVVEGDMVAIFFMHGTPRLPLVIPGIRRLDADDFFAQNHLSESNASPNRLAARLRPLDDEGEIAGLVELEAGVDEDGDPAGDVRVRLDGELRLTVEYEDGEHVIKMLPDGNIEIDAGSARDIVFNGGTAKVSRVGDRTTGHTHDTSLLRDSLGGALTVGTLGTSTDTMAEGAEGVKA